VETLSRVQLTTTLAAFACATLCLASLGGLALRDAWGGAGPQRALLLCYAATLVVYAAAMAAMSPLLDDGPCSRYNASGGLSAMALFLGWLQNSSRFLLLSLQLLHTTAAPWRVRGTALLVPHLERTSATARLLLGCTSAGAALLALSLLLGAVPSVLVYPNTLNEVCSAVKPRLDPATLHLAPNLAWNVLLLLTSCGLFAYGSTRPHAPRRSTAALPPTAHSSDHASDPAADVEARGRGCGGVAPGAAGETSRASLTASMPASSGLPDGLVQGLAAFATLRFFLQCVNTLLVEFDSAVAGAFAEMLVIENVLEHSQAVVLLVLLVSDSSFSGAVAKLRPAAGGEGQGERRQGLGTFNIFAVTGDVDSARRPVSLESDSSGEPIAAADGTTSTGHLPATSHLPASGRRPSRYESPGGMPTLN